MHNSESSFADSATQLLIEGITCVDAVLSSNSSYRKNAVIFHIFLVVASAVAPPANAGMPLPPPLSRTSSSPGCQKPSAALRHHARWCWVLSSLSDAIRQVRACDNVLKVWLVAARTKGVVRIGLSPSLIPFFASQIQLLKKIPHEIRVFIPHEIRQKL